MSLNIYNYEKDYIGKIIENIGGNFYTAGLYRCNGWIACVEWSIEGDAEEPNTTQLRWFFESKEHAKRMLGIAKGWNENFLKNIREWHMVPCKEATELAPLLFKAYKENPYFVFYVDNEQSQERYFKEIKNDKKWRDSQ